MRLIDRLGSLLTQVSLAANIFGRLPTDAQVAMATVDRILRAVLALAVLAGIALAVHLYRNQTAPPYN